MSSSIGKIFLGKSPKLKNKPTKNNKKTTKPTLKNPPQTQRKKAKIAFSFSPLRSDLSQLLCQLPVLVHLEGWGSTSSLPTHSQFVVAVHQIPLPSLSNAWPLPAYRGGREGFSTWYIHVWMQRADVLYSSLAACPVPLWINLVTGWLCATSNAIIWQWMDLRFNAIHH